MAPLILPAGSLPPTLHERVNSDVSLPNIGSLSLSTDGPALETTLLSQWQFLLTLLSDTNSPAFPEAHSISHLGRQKVLALVTALFKLSPPVQAESHIQLLSTFLSNTISGTPLSMQTPPEPKDVIWNRICDVAETVHHGVQAAVTRTGSARHTGVPTPQWLKIHIQVQCIEKIKANILPPGSRNDVLCSSGESQWWERLRPNNHHLVHDLLATTRDSSESGQSLIEEIGTNVARSPVAAAACRVRDSERCAITGRPTQLAAAHIIPYSCGRYTNGFNETHFWFFLRLWLGDSTASKIWDYVGGENINRLENMITLGAEMHGMLGDGKVVFEPALGPTITRHQIRKDIALLRIWGLSEEGLRYTSTWWAGYDSAEQALVAVGDGSREREELESQRPFKDGEVVIVTRNTGYSIGNRADDRRTPLPDPTLFRVLAGVMRMRFEATNGMQELTGKNKANPALTTAENPQQNYIPDGIRKSTRTFRSARPGNQNHSMSKKPTQTPSDALLLRYAHLDTISKSPTSYFANAHTLVNEHQYLRAHDFAKHAETLTKRLAAVQLSQLTGQGEEGQLGFEILKRQQLRREEERLYKRFMREIALQNAGDGAFDDYHDTSDEDSDFEVPKGRCLQDMKRLFQEIESDMQKLPTSVVGIH